MRPAASTALDSPRQPEQPLRGQGMPLGQRPCLVPRTCTWTAPGTVCTTTCHTRTTEALGEQEPLERPSIRKDFLNNDTVFQNGSPEAMKINEGTPFGVGGRSEGGAPLKSNCSTVLPKGLSWGDCGKMHSWKPFLTFFPASGISHQTGTVREKMSHVQYFQFPSRVLQDGQPSALASPRRNLG